MLKYMRRAGVCATALIALLGCKTPDAQTSEVLDAVSDNIASAIAGCYEIRDIRIDTDAQNPMRRLQSARTLCVTDTQTADGVSRSGRFTFEFKDSSNQLVGSQYGYGAAPYQPRCPGCYELSGLDGTVSWDGERTDEPIHVNMNWPRMEASGSIELGQRQGSNNGGNAGPNGIRGTYQGIGFTVDLTRQDSVATIVWDDGEASTVLNYNPNPNPAPRCPCRVYEGSRGRTLILEQVVGGGWTAQYTGPSDNPGGGASMRGVYQGIGFTVLLSNNGAIATLRWDDGAGDTVLQYNPNPNPRPRCPCNVYEGREGRRLILEYGPNNAFRSATYSRR